ncbi:MAG: hypothetical protein DRR08_32425 [Candidatus Parabeggiatoa sp. nov. 2]|nr:MAG: hypothetical protein B6247_02120 [Beggiatoa sp. 4572_84]RKZ47418.1 MAG: hypothetical protein DRR08_32425 [Gammaproteobacteria bacterium]
MALNCGYPLRGRFINPIDYTQQGHKLNFSVYKFLDKSIWVEEDFVSVFIPKVQIVIEASIRAEYKYNTLPG